MDCHATAIPHYTSPLLCIRLHVYPFEISFAGGIKVLKRKDYGTPRMPELAESRKQQSPVKKSSSHGCIMFIAR